MALTRTHKVTEVVDSKSAIFYDTTPLADYVSEGIDIDVDVTSVIITLTGDLTSTDYTYDATAEFAGMRDAGGLNITATDFAYDGTTFIDDLYTITIDLIANATTYTSTTNQFFYATVKNSVVGVVVNTDWKAVFDMNSRESKSKNYLKLKSWLDNLIIADEQGFLTEGKVILAALKVAV